MPPEGVTTAGTLPLDAGIGRHDRPPILAFVADGATEAALRDGLNDVVGGVLEVRRGGIRAAIAALQKSPTPKVLIVDVSGDDQPLTSLGTLSDVVEPQVAVLVVGDVKDVDFYREVTRGLGALEYLSKPLTRDTVGRHFGPLVLGQAPPTEGVLGGRLVTVTGARGGLGASTIAVNLAWHFGVSARRHTVLLDPDLHLGTAAFLLNLDPGRGLRMALETPERIDSLLAERAALPAAERLHVLAGEEKLSVQPVYTPGAATQLMNALRRRYNFIVADVPFAPIQLYRDLLDLSHQRVLVMDPTLAAVRDTLRLLTLPAGSAQTNRPVIVLNRVGQAGGLNRRQVEEALRMKVDVAVPDLPRLMSSAATMGEPAVSARGAFRTAIVDLARQVAFTRLLDSAAGRGDDAKPAKGRWRLFGRSS
jgi:pilus assembly protein CpaE